MEYSFNCTYHHFTTKRKKTTYTQYYLRFTDKQSVGVFETVQPMQSCLGIITLSAYNSSSRFIHINTAKNSSIKVHLETALKIQFAAFRCTYTKEDYRPYEKTDTRIQESRQLCTENTLSCHDTAPHQRRTRDFIATIHRDVPRRT